MGLRFRKSIKLSKNAKINLNKKSIGLTLGTKHFHHTINTKGTTTSTVGLPGTGLSYSKITNKRKKENKKVSQLDSRAQEMPTNHNLLRWILSIFTLIFSISGFACGKMGIIAGILFLIVTLLLNPITARIIEAKGIVLKKLIYIPATIVLFILGIFAFPSTPISTPVADINQNIKADITDNSETQRSITDEIVTLSEKESYSDEKETILPVVENVQESDREIIDEGGETVTIPNKTEEILSQDSSPAVSDNPSSKHVVPITEETESSTTVSTAQEPTESVSKSSNTETTSAISSGTGESNFGKATHSGLYYIVNAKNGKIHNSSCKNLPKEENQIIYETLDEALAHGYSDYCGNCMK